MNQLDPNSLKRAAAARALDYVTDGMKLGLGTGSTAEAFLELLAERVRAGLTVVGTPTSERTADKAEALGIALKDLDGLAPLDLVIDGADESDGNLDLIKGGGGALLREKIVAASAKRLSSSPTSPNSSPGWRIPAPGGGGYVWPRHDSGAIREAAQGSAIRT